MEVRDAVEDDADALASIAAVPADVLRSLIHDRTVLVAERSAESDASTVESNSNGEDASNAEGDSTDGGNSDAESEPSAESDPQSSSLLGFLGFDAHGRTVHVTQLAGTTDACERLLSEPIRFARNEGMSVELVLFAEEDTGRTAAERVGFEKHGPGPMFEGQRTVRYRLDPSAS